jgi:hypothetical protein
MDAGPLIKLAVANQLDVLLAFDRKIYIPDEVYFEAVEKFAWEHKSALTKDKIQLQKWVKAQKASGRVFCPETLVGQIAKQKRDSGEYSPGSNNHRRNTGELAAHDFFNNREEWGHGGDPALILVDDGVAIDKIKLQNLDVYVLTTYSMLLALQEEHFIRSAEDVWLQIEAAIPTAWKATSPNPSGSVRGDTEYRSAIKRRAP